MIDIDTGRDVTEIFERAKKRFLEAVEASGRFDGSRCPDARTALRERERHEAMIADARRDLAAARHTLGLARSRTQRANAAARAAGRPAAVTEAAILADRRDELATHLRGVESRIRALRQAFGEEGMPATWPYLELASGRRS